MEDLSFDDEFYDNVTHTTDCSFNESQRKLILIAMTSTASISVFMCVITITLVFVYKLHKHFTYRLASYQVFSSMCFSGSLIVQISLINNNFNDTPLCETLGFFVEYFMWVKLLFTMSLVFHFFVLAIYLKNLHKFEVIYFVISVTLPLFYVWIPFVRQTYGQAGAWCWIKDWKGDCATLNHNRGIIEQFVLWYGPLYASLTASVIIAIYVGITLARRAYRNRLTTSEAGPLLHTTIQAENTHNQAALKQLIPLLAYPVIFYILTLVPVINRIYDVVSKQVNFTLAIAHAISIGSWGFFSSWALLLHIAIKKKYSTRTGSFVAANPNYSHHSTFQTDAYYESVGSKLESSVSRSE